MAFVKSFACLEALVVLAKMTLLFTNLGRCAVQLSSLMAIHFDLGSFFMFSPVSGIVGQAGQANCASKNSFLDSLAQYRNGLELAAYVVDMGAVEERLGLSLEH